VAWHRFDPEPTFHFDADPDPDLTASFTFFIYSNASFHSPRCHRCQNFQSFRQHLQISGKKIPYFSLVEIETDPDLTK
jgi:hypothetical protein